MRVGGILAIFESLVIALRGMFPPDWIIEGLLKEWPVIRQAPFTFLVISVLMFMVAVFITVPFIYLLFRTRLQSLTARLSLKESEITLLKSQSDDLKERLAYVLPDKTTYSQLTNMELKDAALRFARELYDFAERTNRSQPDETRYWEAKSLALSRAKDNEETSRIHKAYRDKSRREEETWRAARDSEYAKEFQATLTLLRDEIYKRLPTEIRKKYPPPLPDEPLAGARPLNFMAAELQKLATLLPDRASTQ